MVVTGGLPLFTKFLHYRGTHKTVLAKMVRITPITRIYRLLCTSNSLLDPAQPVPPPDHRCIATAAVITTTVTTATASTVTTATASTTTTMILAIHVIGGTLVDITPATTLIPSIHILAIPTLGMPISPSTSTATPSATSSPPPPPAFSPSP